MNFYNFFVETRLIDRTLNIMIFTVNPITDASSITVEMTVSCGVLILRIINLIHMLVEGGCQFLLLIVTST